MNSTPGAATESEMAQLHTDLANELSTMIKEGRTVKIAGKTKKLRASAAVLAVARGFLKDNDVHCAREHASKPVTKLADAVAEHDAAEHDEDDVPRFPKPRLVKSGSK